MQTDGKDKPSDEREKIHLPLFNDLLLNTNIVKENYFM